MLNKILKNRLKKKISFCFINANGRKQLLSIHETDHIITEKYSMDENHALVAEDVNDHHSMEINIEIRSFYKIPEGDRIKLNLIPYGHDKFGLFHHYLVEQSWFDMDKRIGPEYNTAGPDSRMKSFTELLSKISQENKTQKTNRFETPTEHMLSHD